MNTWIMQSGHPIVHIKIINNTTIVLKQERFFFDSNLNNKQKYKIIKSIFSLSNILITLDGIFHSHISKWKWEIQ
jgi:hypothetical protein